MPGWFQKKIAVTFIDDKTGLTIGTSKLRPEELPDTFGPETVFTRGEDDWAVVHADAATREECEKRKWLTLRVCRVDLMNPANILYGAPTLCEIMPNVSDQPAQEADGVLARDDWRQFEFISNEFSLAIENEIAAIWDIHQNHTRGPGWDKLHLRSEIRSPLALDITLPELLSALGKGAQTHCLRFEGAATRIADGFAIEVNGDMLLYGLAPSEQIRVLGILGAERESVPEAATGPLVDLAKEKEWTLVQWCRCQREAPSRKAFEEAILWKRNAC